MAGDDRVVVKTYVPSEQKAAWSEHADELDMSQSEYLRTMAQAGRKGFLADREEDGSGDATPGGRGLEDQVLDSLSEGVLSWDELVAELSGDFEDRLYETVQELEDAGQIRHDPREDGYVLRGDR